MASAPWIVSDELWSRIEPLLPRVERRFRYCFRRLQTSVNARSAARVSPEPD
jgi:hypothetical protein